MAISYKFLILLAVINLTVSQDIQLEGTLKIAHNVLHRIMDIIFNEEDTSKENSLGKPDARAKTDSEENTSNLKTNLETENTVEKVPDKALLKYLTFEVLNQGKVTLKVLSDSMKRQLDISDSILKPRLEVSTNNFMTKVKKYKKDLMRKEGTKTPDIHKLLDITDYASGILLHEEHSLVEKAIAEVTVSPSDLQLVTSNLNSDKVEFKKRMFYFICQKTKVCKVYPGYTDNLADLITKILELSDSKFLKLATTAAFLTKSWSTFFKTIISQEDYVSIRNYMKSLSSDFGIRDFFIKLRFLITTRHKIFDYENNSDKKKVQAIRELFDLIDQVFNEDGEDVLHTMFDKTDKAIKNWSLGFRDDIQTIINTFMEHSIEMCNFEWKDNTRKRIKTIVKNIIDSN